MTQFDYSGTELDVFQHAINWKRYWAQAISPYLGPDVLDVGAGIGATAVNLKEHRFNKWVELEPDPVLAKRIVELRDRGGIPAQVEVRNGSIADLAPDECFDTVLYIDVLEHIEDDRAEVARAMQHVKPGGHVVVLSPAHDYLYTEFDRQIGHFRRYNAQGLRTIAPDGSTVSICKYLDSVGMLASLANRLLLKSGSPTMNQIKAWDRLMVPVSMRLDPLLGYRLGKSIVCVYTKLPR
ncbi:class I SAM-dependent methyltransferase [Luteimonas vadosa]|uniref:Class I SAM-dependent methyltransferase n=1 Tax=Luteimonas vadosa TaxID=1165507 RepID=A0ABP9DV53_9GAMM